MKRRFTLLAIATFLSSTLMAQWNGSDTEEPTIVGGKYQIAKAENLAWIAANPSHWGDSYEQTDDIDLNNKPWTPIGDGTTQFTGSYDGNGYVISNLYYNNLNQNYVGLFGYIKSAKLQNITIASGFVQGSGYTAGVCGGANGVSGNKSEISCCTNNATVYSKNERNAGVCGWAENTTITDCINYGLISGFNFTGGILGHCNKNTVSITRCVNVGQVFGMRYTCGNLVGFNNGSKAILKNCYYDNQINASLGVTTQTGIIETDTDDSEKIEGKATSAMISGELESALGEKWYFEDGLYPRLKIQVGNTSKFSYMNNAIILAATPVKFHNDTDKADNVTEDFVVSTKNSVSWESGESSYLSISKDSIATINFSTAVVLTATKGSYTKKVYLKTNKINATPIGSIDNPLPVANEADLKELRDAVNNYGSYKKCANYDGFKGIYFKQTSHIILESWTESIGIHNSFKGNYNGNNNTIKNINTNGSVNVGGLFSLASYGKIENLTIYGNVSGESFVGGICGSTFKETLENCTSNCTVNVGWNNSYAGGMVGVDKGFSELINCTNNGNVTGGQYCGGIMATSNMETTFDNCENFGTIDCSEGTTATYPGLYVGGICGALSSTSGKCTIINCKNYGKIKAKSTAGGIVGTAMKPSADCEINNCINTGDIEGASPIGGIVGASTKTNVSNCLNLGTINAGGGIAGSIESGYSVYNCFNAGIASNAIASSGEIDSCLNIGKVTSVPAGCHNDSQMSSKSGYNTSDMLGTELQSALGTEKWTFTDGMYPMIKALENSDYMIVAATPVILNEPDDVDGVETAFTYVTGNTVNWVCNKPSFVSFINGTAYLSNPNEDPENVELTVSKGNASKKIAMAIKHVEGTTPTISWVTDLGVIEYGNSFTLSEEQKATISPAEVLSEGRIEYSVTEGTTLNAGSYNISATYIPNAGSSWLTTSTSAHLLVSKKEVPAFTWRPEDKSYPYGNADNNSKIMCAVAKDGDKVIDGTFTYDIPALNAGEQTVKLIGFESTNYEISTLPIEKTITVDPIPVSISWTQPKAIAEGTAISNLQLGAFCAIGGTISYQKVYNEDTTSIEVGDVLPVGKYKLRATFMPSAENSNYAEAFKEVDLAVKAIPTITWSKPDDIANGTALSETQLNASVSPASAGTIKYSLDKAGNTPALGAVLSIGIHPLWATIDESEDYMGAQKSVSIEVVENPIVFDWTPQGFTYGASEEEIQTKIKNATATQGGATLSGLVYTIPEELNAGKQIVSVTVNGVSAERTITVSQATPEITWGTPADITVGTALSTETQLKAEAKYNNEVVAGTYAYTYKGKDADGAIPTVGNNQTISVTFTPTSKNYTSASALVKINVTKATPVVTWDDIEPITYGTKLWTKQLNASIEKGEGSIDYTLADGTNATNALLDAGTHEITATLEQSPNYSEWTMTKTILVNQAEPVITWELGEVAWGASEEEIENNVKNAVAKDAKGNVLEGNFTYVIPELNAVGEVEVSVSFENKNYKTAAATTKKLNVTKAYPVITWTPQSVTYGASVAEMLSLDNAEASYNGEEVKGSFAFDNLSTLHAGTQNINVTFTPENTELFNPVVGTAELTVLKATPTIEWNPKEEIAFGTALNDDVLNAKANVDGTFKYEPTADSVLKVGSLKITATFTPTDAENYENATASVEINVVKANPVITWNTPEDITVGTALTDAQLNAKANVDGTFAYTPDKNSVLEVGEHQKLTVLFTPADAESYNSVSDSVFINVTAAANDTTTTIDTAAAIVWVPSEIVYGTPVGETFNAVSKIDGKITYSLAADSILDAGEYKVIATLSPVNGNDTTIERIVKVAKAELTATAANDTIVKGDTMPKFEINYKGFVGNDNAASLTTAPTATCSASTDSVGSFEIVVSGGEAKNYNFVHVNGLLVILAKNDTALIPIDTVPHNDTLPHNDTVIVPVITWVPAVDTITYGTLIDSTILNATANVEGKFSYAAVKIEIRPIAYIPETVFTGNEPEADTIYTTRSLAIGDTLNAGTYELIATFIPDDSTMNAVNDTVMLTVNKAVLTVSVADVTINQGDELPTFTISCNGFVLGENESNLEYALQAKCDASTDEAGTYEIMILGCISNNYEFDKKNGTLTVLKKDDDVAINETAAIFEVYPNPSNGAFFVNAGDEAQEVRIFNSTGKLVKVETIEGVTRIDISEYADGMYFVKLGNQSKPIIKQ